MIFLKRYKHYIKFIKTDIDTGLNAYNQPAVIILRKYSINALYVIKTYHLPKYKHNINIITLNDLFVINQFKLTDVCCRHIQHVAYSADKVRKIIADITFAYTDEIPLYNKLISEVNVCVMQKFEPLYVINDIWEMKNCLIITNLSHSMSRNTLRKYIKYHQKRAIKGEFKMRIYTKGKYRMTI